MNNNETTKYFGTCKFCGQMSLGTVEGAASEEEANIAVMMECKCAGAFDFRKKMKQKEEAKQNLRALFVDKNERWNSMENDGLLKFLDTAIDHVVENEISSISLGIPGIGSAKISSSSKGVVIERRKTVAGKITAEK